VRLNVPAGLESRFPQLFGVWARDSRIAWEGASSDRPGPPTAVPPATGKTAGIASAGSAGDKHRRVAGSRWSLAGGGALCLIVALGFGIVWHNGARRRRVRRTARLVNVSATLKRELALPSEAGDFVVQGPLVSICARLERGGEAPRHG